MEISSIRGLPELGMCEPYFIHPWQMSSLEELNTFPISAAFGENLQHSFSHSSFNPKTSIESVSQTSIDRPMKQLKTDGWNSGRTDHIQNPPSASSHSLLSFAISNDHTTQFGTLKPKDEVVSPNSLSFPSDILVSQGSYGNQNRVFKACQEDKRISTTPRVSQAHDHIIAERKRREKLSQRFIALSAIVPGLKKTDKASVLGDAIKYLKHLQEQVKTLEEQTRKKTMESVVFVKKTHIIDDGENSSSDENFSGSPQGDPLPEIEARFSDKNVLIRIHCEKKKGVTEKILSEIEQLHLIVTNSSVMTFGNSALDVTIIAQMDLEFHLTAKDLVKNLRTAFKLFM
ncbi:transcription factor bHLH18-like isoform X2 [Malania oleifera]|uniref:transcription factor bHLH18-like isoform X2 n=1 Tax=Malania oleifera TaxID=397392 RepID=UPI0025ADE7D5|nr:transcription factor bHLH18-like isoform X2 [Malania oleifera]